MQAIVGCTLSNISANGNFEKNVFLAYLSHRLNNAHKHYRLLLFSPSKIAAILVFELLELPDAEHSQSYFWYHSVVH